MNRRSFLASGLTIAEWPGLDAAWANAVEFYVGRNGRDENPGDKRKPFAIIVRARNEVRKLIANGLKAKATVRNGQWHL